MTSNTTHKMVYGRAEMITSITGIKLEVTKDSQGWTVYHVDETKGNRRLSELFFSDSTYGAFTALKAIYNFATIMKERIDNEAHAVASEILDTCGMVDTE